jgi:hypothetical protein
MKKPWEIAVNAMSGYYSVDHKEWPGHEATAVLGAVKLGKDHRWLGKATVHWADAVLQRARFDVDDVIENHLGIQLSFDRLDYLDKVVGVPVYGVACPDTREIIVCERVQAYEPFCRTTLLHEAGHVLLHGSSECGSLMFTPGRRASGAKEAEANQFMRVALLPRPVLKLAICYFCHVWGIDVRLALGSANSARGRWLWRKRLFSAIIDQLCVSRELTAIMMKQMGCFSAETVRYHKAYRLKTRWNEPAVGSTLAKSFGASLD